jgi:hypothetical protein
MSLKCEPSSHRSVDTAAASDAGEEIDEEPWALQFV